LAGGDSIHDTDVLRAGSTQICLGHRVAAPSTTETFLRSFTWGHARQLDRVSGVLLGRPWAAGGGPGAGPETIDIDSSIHETYRPFGKTAPLVRLIIRRVKPTPGSQLTLFTTWSYHGFVTDRTGETISLEADHRRHAEVENTILRLGGAGQCRPALAGCPSEPAAGDGGTRGFSCEPQGMRR